MFLSAVKLDILIWVLELVRFWSQPLVDEETASIVPSVFVSLLASGVCPLQKKKTPGKTSMEECERLTNEASEKKVMKQNGC